MGEHWVTYKSVNIKYYCQRINRIIRKNKFVNMGDSENNLKLKLTLHSVMKTKNRSQKPKYLHTIQKLKPLNNNEKKLHRAVIFNNTEAVAEILEAHVNPNAFDTSLRTPLHFAASRGYKRCAELLLDHGADPNQKDIIGNTPLHLAACTNNIEIVTLLLNAGTDVNSVDQHGRSALQLAQGKLKILQSSHKVGAVEISHLREQLHQVVNLMISVLKVKIQNMDHLEKIKYHLNRSSGSELDSHMDTIMKSLQDMNIN